MGSGMGSSFSCSEYKDHADTIGVLIHLDTEQHRRLRFEKGKVVGKLTTRLRNIRQPDMRACTEQFSENAVSILQGEIADALNYKVEVEESGVSWTVIITRKQIESLSDASRTVCFIDN